MGVLVVTVQRIPDAAEGAVRTFDGGSKTIADLLADATGLESGFDAGEFGKSGLEGELCSPGATPAFP